MLYNSPEFIRWRDVFEKQELKSWYIYSNAVFRFFSQAAHRISARRLSVARNDTLPVLEIGAGSGALLRHMHPKRYVGIDIAMDGLAELKRRFPEALVICASATRLPFSDDAFEHIVCYHTLEHLYHIAESLEEMSRVMSDDGILDYGIPTEGGFAFWLGRQLLTGRHLRRTYDLDVNHVMDREHINDAPRVLKFLRLHFQKVERRYWPIRFLPLLSINALIYGQVSGPLHRGPKDVQDDNP